MARDVDRVLDFIRTQAYIPPIHRQVMLDRLEKPPTNLELEAAKKKLYPEVKNLDPWKDSNG